VLVGLGYSSPERTGNDFDFGVGVRVDLPPDPYARARYEIVRAFGEHYVFTARETVFWQNTEGFGTTTRFYLDRGISDKLLLRWTNPRQVHGRDGRAGVVHAAHAVPESERAHRARVAAANRRRDGQRSPADASTRRA
jgi:hypothetical protein